MGQEGLFAWNFVFRRKLCVGTHAMVMMIMLFAQLAEIYKGQ